MSADLPTLLLIVALGVGTYATRIGGYLILARLEKLNPRVEAALEAVPAAVMTAIVAPVALTSGIAEGLATIATVVAALRLPIHATLVVGAGLLVALRSLGL